MEASTDSSPVFYYQAISHEQHLLIPVCEDDEQDNLILHQQDLNTVMSEESNRVVPPHRHLPLRPHVKDLINSLPKNLHLEKQRTKEQQQSQYPASDKASAQLDTLQEEESVDEAFNDGDADNSNEGLDIAWQYRTSVQQQRLGLVSTTGRSTQNTATTASTSRILKQEVFCHSFDLNGLLNEQLDVFDFVHFCTADDDSCNPDGWTLYQSLLRQVLLLCNNPARNVVRILLYHVETCALSIALPLLLAYVRNMELPVVLLVVVEPWTTSSPSRMRLICTSCDVVLKAEGFAARREYPPPSEFRLFHGLLKVTKLNTLTAATANGGGHFCDGTVSKRPSAFLFGLKRDRRKLHIQLLHIPPEEFGSTGNHTERSGTGRSTDAAIGCGAGVPSNFDF
jgi:hypothetical protein